MGSGKILVALRRSAGRALRSSGETQGSGGGSEGSEEQGLGTTGLRGSREGFGEG